MMAELFLEQQETVHMKMTDFLMAQLEREARSTRRALERVPEGRNDWQPHPKSMQLGYLAALVAKLPSWIAMTVHQDEYDMYGPHRATYHPVEHSTNAELLSSFEESLAAARGALQDTTDAHLMKPWQFKVGAQVVSEEPRYIMISDAVLSHLAHHRGQLTVYLRLNGIPVPAIYGSTADEH